MLQGRERLGGVGESRWKGERNRAKPKNHQPKKDLGCLFLNGENFQGFGKLQVLQSSATYDRIY